MIEIGLKYTSELTVTDAVTAIAVGSGDDGQLFHHTHALFSFKKDGQHGMAGGHLKSTTVLYTAEIEVRPTVGGSIGRKFDPETGTGFWNFK
jgi:hypothetical protein